MVSRMRTISIKMKEQAVHLPVSALRVIGVSATISNADDISDWLSANGAVACITKQFGDEYRPVPLQWRVQTYNHVGIVFKFDAFLASHLFKVIQENASQRPSLIFCNSKKAAEQAAEAVAHDARGSLLKANSAAHETLARAATQTQDARLRTLIRVGCAFHSSALTAQDRRIVEQCFADGVLPVLCCTSGLAQGLSATIGIRTHTPVNPHCPSCCCSSLCTPGDAESHPNRGRPPSAARCSDEHFDVQQLHTPV